MTTDVGRQPWMEAIACEAPYDISSCETCNFMIPTAPSLPFALPSFSKLNGQVLID